MTDAWGNLPSRSGDAWDRMHGTAGDAWARLPGTTGDAWARLTAAVASWVRICSIGIAKAIMQIVEITHGI